MRLIVIILLCASVNLSASDDEPTNNEVSVDEALPKERDNSIDGRDSRPNSDADRVIEADDELTVNEADDELTVNAAHDELTVNEADDELTVNEADDELTVNEAYENAVHAYLDDNWDGCIAGFTRAIASYKKYKKAIINCRRECREKAAGSAPIFPENIEDLHFYEKKVRETLCLLNCNQDYRDVAGAQSLKRISNDIETNYIQRTPYQYLHICYYQKNLFQKAANAMYTYLVIHPKHEMSLQNLRHYVALPEVDEKQVTDLEAYPFLKMYMDGVAAYDDQLYSDVVNNLEKSLESYLQSEEDCRFYCEGHFDQGWLPEFTPSIANHFTYSLKCKRGCSKWLNNVNGQHQRDLLPSHYHYLQYAYYKIGDVKNAAAAVASYLLFYPSDETMLENKDYYFKLPKVEKDYFTPREEALNYVKRQEYELHLLLTISEEFAAIGARLNAAKNQSEEKEREDVPAQLANHPPPGHSPGYQLRFTRNEMTAWEERNKLRAENTGRAIESADAGKEVRIIADENDLGGKLRYVADGFLNNTACDSLIHLAQTAAVEGDGYEGNASPHSTYERFEGLTLGRAALMVYFGQLEPEVLELALGTTETARDHVERYFNLDRHLYFSYTHLACRSALPDSPVDRQDLSHAIHADNCIVAENGSCAAEWPAYVFRDYSAIIYLNDEFEGGEFVFAGDSKAQIVQSTVKPRCGRMVAFSASGINLHGVRGVLRGKRCALALWFTFDKEHLEIERIVARAVIKRVRIHGSVTPENNESTTSTEYEDTLFHQFDIDDKLNHLYHSLEPS